MPAVAFLALVAIAMLVLAGIRLELDFRRSLKSESGPRPQGTAPGSGSAAPELRIGPAGGYCQRPFAPPGFGKAPQARRAGFAL
ncbi:MAG TPA: hypothetical protein VD846_05030 [Allosphingosinicella sp.]|nr:hypothetical protein [Allosphingosinicella sp.]